MPGLIGKRSYEEMEEGSRGPGPALHNPESADYGETPRKRQMMDLPNGVPVSQSEAASSALTNGTHPHHQSSLPSLDPNETLRDLENDLPPELPSSVDPNAFRNLGTLVSRMAQNTFQGLMELVDNLAASPSGEDDRTNGVVYSSKEHLIRKKRLWDFVNDARGKFIKLLVLSQWSRNAKAIQKLIDILFFFSQLKFNINHNVDYMGVLVGLLRRQETATPDLVATMRILAEGKADWIPHMGFVPEEELSAGDLLHAMRRINTLLTVRLGMQDVPPECMRKYRIHDGRVTFVVQDEFELDLTMTGEEQEAPLAFLDLRFIFTPGGGPLPDGRLRDEIAFQVEQRLQQEQGLQKSHDFLHNLVLTHKIAILNSQARKLRRGRWGDNIDVTEANRSLVIEYWKNRVGGAHKKNWIEIGIKKHPSPEEIASGLQDTSQLSIRWHRHGKEILHHGINIDSAELSMETILKDTIATHTSYILSAVRKDLRKVQNDSEGSVYRTKQRRSPVEPADCNLEVEFPDGTRITVAQEPITGRIGLLPPTNLHSYQEKKINALADPAAHCGDIIRQLRASSAADSFSVRLSMAGWERVPVPNLGKQTLKSTFHRPDVYRIEYCRPPHWTDEWCFALTHHLSGSEIWHLMRLKEDMNAALSAEDKMLGREKTPFKSSTMICYDPSGHIQAIAKESTASTLWNVQSSVPLQSAFAATKARTESGQAADFQSNKYAFLFSLAAHGAAIASQIANGDQLSAIEKLEKKHNLYEYEPDETHTSSQPVANRDDGRFETLQSVAIASLLLRLWNDKLTRHYEDKVRIDFAGVYPSDGTVVTVCRAELREPMPVSTEILRFPGGALQVDGKDSPRVAVQISVKVGESIILRLVDALLSFARVMSCVNVLQKHTLDVRQVEFNKIEVSLDSINTGVVSRGYVLSPQQLRVTFYRTDPEAKEGMNVIEFDQASPYARNVRAWQDALSTHGLNFVAARLPKVHQVTATVNELSRMEISVRPYVAFRDTRIIRLVWGSDGGPKIELAISFALTSSMRTVWNFQLAQVTASATAAPDAITRLVDSWNKEFKYKKGTTFTSTGAKSMIVNAEDASTMLWRIFDLIKPFISELYESLQKNGDKSATEDGKDADKDKEKDKDQKNAKSEKLESKKNGSKKAAETITID